MKQCNQCGKCCIKYGAESLSASGEDISWWDHHKPHIYQYVKNGNIWFDPVSASPLKRCPWLRKQSSHIYTCDIYYDRPEDCRLYPSKINEMISDACEMLEKNDLLNTKQAQLNLDDLMRSSRRTF